MPQQTSSSRVSPLPPSHIYDEDYGEEDSEDDGPFGDAHSPSEFCIKCQNDEEEGYQDYYTPEPVPKVRPIRYEEEERYPYPQREEMIHVPRALIAGI